MWANCAIHYGLMLQNSFSSNSYGVGFAERKKYSRRFGPFLNTTLPTLPTPPRQSPTDVHKAQVPRSKTVLKREPPHPTGPVSAKNSFGKEGKTDLVSLLTFFFFLQSKTNFLCDVSTENNPAHHKDVLQIHLLLIKAI